MQKENSQSDGNFSNPTNDRHPGDFSPQPSSHPILSPTTQSPMRYSEFASFYPSVFLSKTNSISISPSDCSFDDDTSSTAETQNCLYQASLVLEYQQLYNRYTLCLAQLQNSIKEVDSLRVENNELLLANSDLVQRLSLLSQATIQNCLLSSGRPSLSLINEFNRLVVGGNSRDVRASEVSNVSPMAVSENNLIGRRNVGRVSLPKSISVRSSGYSKTSRNDGNDGGPSQGASRQRVTDPGLSGSQRVYVPGSKTEEEALEFEVYNQGMFKTELCNKWQETGTCPYGDHCQFAHGITELRPVIRHPRYKTEVCRMVLVGDMCPYGHRCHFRHSLTEQEKLVAPR